MSLCVVAFDAAGRELGRLTRHMPETKVTMSRVRDVGMVLASALLAAKDRYPTTVRVVLDCAI